MMSFSPKIRSQVLRAVHRTFGKKRKKFEQRKVCAKRDEINGHICVLKTSEGSMFNEHSHLYLITAAAATRRTKTASSFRLANPQKKDRNDAAPEMESEMRD